MDSHDLPQLSVFLQFIHFSGDGELMMCCIIFRRVISLSPFLSPPFPHFLFSSSSFFFFLFFLSRQQRQCSSTTCTLLTNYSDCRALHKADSNGVVISVNVAGQQSLMLPALPTMPVSCGRETLKCNIISILLKWFFSEILQ